MTLAVAGTVSAETVSGRVELPNAVPPPAFQVTAYVWQGGFRQMVANSAVNGDGTYQLTLPPGSYVLVAEGAGFGGYYMDERWPDVRCSAIDRESCFPINQTQFDLAAGENPTGVNFTPELGGTLGASFLPMGPNPQNYQVVVYTATDSPPYYPWREIVGSTFHGAPIPPGNYYLVGGALQPNFTFLWQAWRRRDCPGINAGNCDLRYAQQVRVTAGQGSGAQFDFRTVETPFVNGFEAPWPVQRPESAER